MNPLRTLTPAAALALAVALAALVAAPAAAGTAAGPPEGLTWRATIDDREVSTGTANDPIPLPAGRDLAVDLVVENRGAAPVTVRAVRLQGRVLGMSFFSFTSQIDLTVVPGSAETRAVSLDLGELGDQAVGLIPADLSLLAPDRSVIDEAPVATDVRGSLASAYGLFGLAVGAVTLVLLLSLALEIAQHRLPVNRWRRAVRFLAPGFGVGLVATFTLSATRVLLPSATVWVPLVLGCGAVAFLVGYLTPPPPGERWGSDGYVGQHREDDAYPELDAYEPPPMLAPRHPAPEALETEQRRSLP
jgi:hypothetical protein